MKRLFAPGRGDYFFVLGMLVFALLYLALGLSYKPALREVPVPVACIVIALLVLDLVSRTETALGAALRRRLNPIPARPAYPATRQIEAVLWVAGFALLLVLLGILAAVPVFVFAFMRWRGKRGLIASFLAAGGATLFIWLLFALLLRLTLYPGLVFQG